MTGCSRREKPRMDEVKEREGRLGGSEGGSDGVETRSSFIIVSSFLPASSSGAPANPPKHSSEIDVSSGRPSIAPTPRPAAAPEGVLSGTRTSSGTNGRRLEKSRDMIEGRGVGHCSREGEKTVEGEGRSSLWMVTVAPRARTRRRGMNCCSAFGELVIAVVLGTAPFPPMEATLPKESCLFPAWCFSRLARKRSISASNPAPFLPPFPTTPPP
jgi:hypothetical protein